MELNTSLASIKTNNFKAMKMKQPTPKVGVAVILKRKDKILVLLRHGSHKSKTWALPGGHMEIGEEFADTCKREVAEELGVLVAGVKKIDFANNIFKKEGLHYVTLYFSAIWDENQEPKILEPEKIKAIRWVNGLDLPKPFFSKNAGELIRKFSGTRNK